MTVVMDQAGILDRVSIAGLCAVQVPNILEVNPFRIVRISRLALEI